jgi:AcrR family transcriptional regulator
MAEQQATPGGTRHSAPGRSRRRGVALEDALLNAAWEEVSSAGYAKFTMDGVAARAGTAKAVIYRRWPNQATLIRAALRHRLGPFADDIPDTGQLRRDLLGVLRRYRDYIEQIGPDIIHGLASDAADLPQDVFGVTPGVITVILERAAGRGEVQAGRITPRIAALPGNLLRYELLSPHGDRSDASLTGIVDEIFLPLVTSTPPSPSPGTSAGPAADRREPSPPGPVT